MKKLLILMLCALCAMCSGCKNAPTDATQVTGKIQSEEVYRSLDNKTVAWGLSKKPGQRPGIPGYITDVLDKYSAIYMGNPESKKVYLTFDEGYENGYSALILDTLKEKNVPAAFFITGDYLKEEPELVKRMTDEGHIVANHTQNHPSMPSVKSTQKLAEELYTLDNSYYELTGKHMKYIRPPKGEYSEKTLAISRDMGYTTVLWSFAYVDWKTDEFKGADYAYNQFMPYLHNGEVILLHAVSKDNAEALGKIIDDTINAGYTFASLDDFE